MMNIFVFCGAWIGCKPVGVNSRAGFDMLCPNSINFPTRSVIQKNAA